MVDRLADASVSACRPRDRMAPPRQPLAPTSPARVAAFRALRLLSESPIDLGEALRRARDPLDDARDRALATDLVTGTLRWRGALDYQLVQRLARPLARTDAIVVDALRLGAYQLLYLDRVPDAAVVHDSVEIVKRFRVASAASLVNAVLRRLARERGALVWPARPGPAADAPLREPWVEYLSVVQSHPAWLVGRWVDRYGASAAEAWLAFNNAPPPLALAPNRLRVSRDQLAALLATEGIATSPTAIAPHGLTTRESRVLRTDAFRRGDFLVQDEASQIVPQLAGRGATRVLDACAAPGGKTLALAAAAGTGGLVVATDVRPRRVRLLAETMARAGAKRVRIVQIDPQSALPFAASAFDTVLVDAPCSGLGTLRREPDIRWRRTPGDLPTLALAQCDLLTRAGAVVRPGGWLVYSTCSSEPEENEDVVRAFLETHPAFATVPVSDVPDLPPAVAVLSTHEGYLRTTPIHGLEAFFGAVLQRTR
jgi:16S rRNA (cytosine967-C5)-methyltransferase